jgi:hypothetical protein
VWLLNPPSITTSYIVLARSLGAGLLTAQATSRNVIALDATTTYQTISGWEATAEAGQNNPYFPKFKDALFDQAVNDLGINRIRLEIRSGAENVRDYWSEHRRNQTDYQTWRCVRYSTVNDNDDPLDINWDGFQFSELDHTVETVVLPLKRRLETRAQKLLVNVNYVSFVAQMNGSSCPSGLDYHHDNSPEEYAEFVLATVLHLRDKYGLVPDLWEVILEPDNTPFWRGRQIAEDGPTDFRRASSPPRQPAWARRFPTSTTWLRFRIFCSTLQSCPITATGVYRAPACGRLRTGQRGTGSAPQCWNT